MKKQPTNATLKRRIDAIAFINNRVDAINAQANKDLQALSKIINNLSDENDALMAEIAAIKEETK